jgi:hypothetical protein
MTLAEGATDVEGGPEVMHVSAIEVDGTAPLLGSGRLRGVAVTLGGGGPPMGLGLLLLLLEVWVLLSAI